MNRKKFISSILPLGVAATGLGQLKAAHTNSPGPKTDTAVYIPPYLNPGDTIGILCPAGNITREEIQPAVNKIMEWGFRVKIGDTVGKKDFTFGGTDDERLADLQQMFDDKQIRAIMPARGGYGMVRIIDRLNFDKFVQHPKWIIGFSDLTVLHSHIHRHFNIATIHSKMCNSFPDDWSTVEPAQIQSIESIRECLSGKQMEYMAIPNIKNKPGTVTGQLVGGNLKTMESLAGSRSDINTNNKILFLEDTGEYLYSIDRMFWNLERSGKLSRLKGLILGGFKVKKDDPGEEFGISVEEMLLEKIKKYDYPVCFDFPVGHQKNNMALKCGLMHQLQVDEKIVSLKEI